MRAFGPNSAMHEDEDKACELTVYVGVEGVGLSARRCQPEHETGWPLGEPICAAIEELERDYPHCSTPEAQPSAQPLERAIRPWHHIAELSPPHLWDLGLYICA